MNKQTFFTSVAVAAMFVCLWPVARAVAAGGHEAAGGSAQQSRKVDAGSDGASTATDAPVLNKALGVLTAGHHFYTIIPANQPLPYTYSSIFATAEDDQTAIDIHLVQKGPGGEDKILDATLGNLPPRPAGKLELHIQVKVDRNKNLTFKMTTPETEYAVAFGPFHLDRPDPAAAEHNVRPPAKPPRTADAVTAGPVAPETAETLLNRALDKYTGVGGPVDKVAARSLFGKACDGGMAQACYNLGVMKDQGEAGEVDKSGARALYQVACEVDMADACNNLAAMKERGEGGQVDKPAARQLYEQACEGGMARSCYSLGVMMERGMGGPVDEVAARARYQQACKGGYGAACSKH